MGELPCPAWVGTGSGLLPPQQGTGPSWPLLFWSTELRCLGGAKPCGPCGAVHGCPLLLPLLPSCLDSLLRQSHSLPGQQPRPATPFLAPGSLPSAGHTFGIPAIVKERKTCPAPTSLWLPLPLPKGHLDAPSLPPPPASSLQATPLSPVLINPSLWMTFL